MDYMVYDSAGRDEFLDFFSCFQTENIFTSISQTDIKFKILFRSRSNTHPSPCAVKYKMADHDASLDLAAGEKFHDLSANAAEKQNFADFIKSVHSNLREKVRQGLANDVLL